MDGLMIPAGKTGLERGSELLVLDTPPKNKARYRAVLSRVSATALDGTKMVVEYLAQTTPELWLRMEVLTEAQVEVLQSLCNGTGPLTVRTDPAGSDQTVVIGPDHQLEPHFGAYPDTAPDRLRRYWAEVKLIAGGG